ncbi:MAG: ElyC/SanA/YdcF family protein [Candidatus Zambryskibacteria bacterium]
MDTIELIKEFEDLYKNPPIIPKDADALVILQGALDPKEEDISRIKCGLNVLKVLGRPIPVIFSGATESRAEKLAQMEQSGIPKELCHFQDGSKLGVINTKTQFEILITDPLTKDFKNLVIVTSTYHIPRVKRTVGKFLPEEIRFVAVGNPEDWKIHNSFLKIIDEIKKIIAYSDKGDILIYPR